MLTPEERAAWAMRVREAIRSRSLETADRKTLVEFSTYLCEPGASDALKDSAVYEQSCELVRLHLLLDYMRKAEKRSSCVQYVVIALTVASIIGTVGQVWYGYKADKRAEAEQESSLQQHKAPQSQMSAPSLAPPPSTRPTSSPAGLPTSGISVAK
jgi:hypothetical protein